MEEQASRSEMVDHEILGHRMLCLTIAKMQIRRIKRVIGFLHGVAFQAVLRAKTKFNSHALNTFDARRNLLSWYVSMHFELEEKGSGQPQRRSLSRSWQRHKAGEKRAELEDTSMAA